MISYIKRLLSKKEGVKQVVVETPKDISEPVISFVECVRNNPRRFKYAVFPVEDQGRYTCLEMYTLKDRVSGEIFTARRNRMYRYGETPWTFPAFVTKDEGDFLAEQLHIIFSGKKERLVRLKTLRKERTARVERDRLKSIYCKEGVCQVR